MVRVALALDVGGTKLAGGLVTPSGEVVRERVRPTPPGDPGLDATAELAGTLWSDAAQAGLDVACVGVGMPEYVSRKGELTSREVLAWTSQPADVLAAACPGVPVVVESDVRCGAVAEWRLGAGRPYDGLLYVSLGTGLSSTLIANGAVVAGHRGEAIALGELAVPAAVDPAWTGNLETFASGAGIASRQGDLPSAGRAVGWVLADLVAVLDPPIVVVGGGLGTAASEHWSALRSTYAERTSRRPDPPPLVQATLGPQAGLIGAALSAFAR